MNKNAVMKNSNIFKMLNRQCSKDSYLATTLRDCDYLGFSAAGILVIDDTYDLISENREGVDVLSIPGGKRDGLEEEPQHTALREYKEEGGSYSISPLDMKKVLWYAPGKYALFIVEKDHTSLSTSDIPNLHSFSESVIDTYLSLRK